MEKFPQNIPKLDKSEPEENKIEKSKVREGVDFVFEQNPELASIGTKEQYSDYLESIFPNSKVRDIVWHGSNYKFGNFSKIELGKTTASDSSVEGFFFADNIDAAKHYANKERILTAYDKIKLLHGNESFKLKKLEKQLNLLKNEYDNLQKNTPSFSKKEKIVDAIHKVFNGQSAIEEIVQTIEQSKNKLKSEIETLEAETAALKASREELRGKLAIAKKVHNELGVSESVFYETDAHYIHNVEKYNKAYEEISKLFTVPEYGKYIYPILLNIQKPIIHNDKGDSKSFFFGDTIREDKSSGADSTIIKNTLDPLPLDLYVVFDPEQIHILASTTDTKKFKEFIEAQKTDPDPHPSIQ